MALAATAAITAVVGCAKSETDILVEVSADATVPPLLILKVTLTDAAGGQSSSSIRSTLPSDSSAFPGAFPLPLLVPVSVDPSLAGTVGITVQGIDWNTYAVVATGSTTATVVPQQETKAAVTLTAVPAGGADGGAGDPDARDAGGPGGGDG